MIGTKIYKDKLDNYTEVAQWCNANNATIVERGYAGAELMGTDKETLIREYKETVEELLKLQKEVAE